jgi:hypothetical protein
MKPFDLEQALAGHPVQTRDGRPVTQLVKFDCKYDYCVFGVLDDAPASWMESGQHTCDGNNPYDLFMAPVKKTGWVVTDTNSLGERFMRTRIYENQEEAQKEFFGRAIRYHEIEWMED